MTVPEDGVRAERLGRGGLQLGDGAAPAARGDEAQDVVAGDEGRGGGLGVGMWRE